MIKYLLRSLLNNVLRFSIITAGTVVGCHVNYVVGAGVGFISAYFVSKTSHNDFVTSLKLRNEVERVMIEDLVKKINEIKGKMGITDTVAVIIREHGLGVKKISRERYAVLVGKDLVSRYGAEVVNAIAHELAHIKLRHLEKIKIVDMVINAVFVVGLVGSILISYYIVAGYVLVFVSLAYVFENAFTQRIEIEADMYAVQFVDRNEYSDLLKRMVVDFSDYAVADKLSERFKFLFPHPPASERVKNIST